MIAKSDVFVGIPCYSSQVHHETCQGLMESVSYFTHFSWVVGCCNVGQARARLVQQFLASPAKTLVMIDSDMVFNRPHMHRLLSHPEDVGVVAGLYRLRNINNALSYMALEDHVPPTKPELFEVAAVGTGFIRIQRWVIEKMIDRYPHRRVTDDNVSFWDFFPVETRLGKFVSDDYAFCRLAREAGVKIWADAGLPLGHKHTITLNLEMTE